MAPSLTRRGSPRSLRARPRRRAPPTRTNSPRPPAPGGPAAPASSSSAILDRSSGRWHNSPSWHSAIERAALDADPRVTGVEQAVYGGSAERSRFVSSTGIAGEYESSSCFAYTQALVAEEDGAETGLGFDLARGPAGLDPEAVGREAAARATAMIGASKPESRACPVVLDPTVAASFIGLIGGVLGADAMQRGRSPFAGRLGEEVAGDRARAARRWP